MLSAVGEVSAVAAVVQEQHHQRARQHQQPRQQIHVQHLTLVRGNPLLPVPGKRRCRRNSRVDPRSPDCQIYASPPDAPLFAILITGTTACLGPMVSSASGPWAQPQRLTLRLSWTALGFLEASQQVGERAWEWCRAPALTHWLDRAAAGSRPWLEMAPMERGR